MNASSHSPPLRHREGAPRLLCLGWCRDHLRSAGHDVDWCGDWSADPGDEEILRRAHADARVLITLDKDVGEHAVVHHQAHSGIVRLVAMGTKAQCELSARILERYGDELPKGRSRDGDAWPRQDSDSVSQPSSRVDQIQVRAHQISDRAAYWQRAREPVDRRKPAFVVRRSPDLIDRLAQIREESFRDPRLGVPQRDAQMNRGPPLQWSLA